MPIKFSLLRNSVVNPLSVLLKNPSVTASRSTNFNFRFVHQSTAKFNRFVLPQSFIKKSQFTQLCKYSSSASTGVPSPKVSEDVREIHPSGTIKTSIVKPQFTLTATMGSAGTDMDLKALSQYILPLDQPVVNLDCTEAFNGLSDQEKQYAHYLSQASWIGGLTVLVQTSPESPLIFTLLHDMFKSNGIEGLKTIAINESGFTEDEWKALVVYATGVFTNMGNYKGFGDTKMIPGLPLNKLAALISKAKFSLPAEEITLKWNAVKDKMYSLTDREKQLGLGEKGITTYFSDNCTKEDSDLIVRFMKKNKLDGWNTRCFKKTEGTVVSYEIRSASAKLDDGSQKTINFEGVSVTLTKGDYSPLMEKVAHNLEKAKEFASNETEKNMLDCYIKSFREGSLDQHKDGSRFWIKDKGPAIETYIGFIENYRDPAGIRAEFEGFVAVMNRTMSKKFNTLVEKAPEFLKLLPWSADFEKDTFMKPDFTSLDVLTFAGSGIPAGINIPNYDEIRQNEGFKNVSLGNVIPASYKDSVIPFLSQEDKDCLNKYRVPAFEVQVALHELLGHGSGKLLKKNEDGSTNYSAELKNPLTDQLIEHVYDFDDTYDSIFGEIGSAYEECRAECVGLLLSLNKQILSLIFGFEGEEAENIIYTNWLSMVFAGAAKALEMYQPKTSSWMQAHSQARFAILQVLIEAGEGLVTVEETLGVDGKPDLVISVDRSKINTIGRKAISDFLLKIQIYKATADINSAKKMFLSYTKVSNDGKYPWANWRDIIMDKKQPRKAFVQPSTFVNGDTVTLKSYESTPEGVVESWIERFPDNSIYKDLDYCWKKDKPFF